MEYRKALSLVSGAEKVTCLQRIGKIHAAEGDHPEALSSYLQALAIDPQRSEIYFHLADAFEALGREQEAQDARRRGLAIQSEAGMAPEGFDRTSLSSPADRGHG